MVRRSAKRSYGRGRAPTEYERVVLAGKPIDERTAHARLFRHIEDAIHRELGGRENLTTAQLALARRAAALSLRAEQDERALVEGEDVDLGSYRATSAELRRVLEALGLSRGDRTTQASVGRQADPYAEAIAAAEEAER